MGVWTRGGRPIALVVLNSNGKKASRVGCRSSLSVDAALAEELTALSKDKRCPPVKRATDDAIRDYIERQKNRSEQQWWDETRRRVESVNHVQSPDDIAATEMFEVALSLLRKEFGGAPDFRAPQILTGGTPRARPVYMTAGAGVDLCELWRVVFSKRAFRANAALNNVGDFIERINTGLMLQVDVHDDHADGLRSMRLPSLPALTVLFVHNPRRIVIVRIVYPGMECEGLVPAPFARKKHGSD